MKKDSLRSLAPEMSAAIDRATVYHCDSISCERDLRSFVADALSYMPGWMRFLYRIRVFLVRLLGSKDDHVPEAVTLRPEDVSFVTGHAASFFTVHQADQNKGYWFSEATNNMLTCHLGVVREHQNRAVPCFHIITLVTFHHWTGRVYYTIICPFHYFVVRCMLKAACRQAQARQ